MMVSAYIFKSDICDVVILFINVLLYITEIYLYSQHTLLYKILEYYETEA